MTVFLLVSGNVLMRFLPTVPVTCYSSHDVGVPFQEKQADGTFAERNQAVFGVELDEWEAERFETTSPYKGVRCFDVPGALVNERLGLPMTWTNPANGVDER